jgi:hypothetical protein
MLIEADHSSKSEKSCASAAECGIADWLFLAPIWYSRRASIQVESEKDMCLD